nr:hypothetical protein [Achromobacter insuavis]
MDHLLTLPAVFSKKAPGLSALMAGVEISDGQCNTLFDFFCTTEASRLVPEHAVPNACPHKSASRSLDGSPVVPVIEPLVVRWVAQPQRSRERLAAMVAQGSIGHTMLKSSS